MTHERPSGRSRPTLILVSAIWLLPASVATADEDDASDFLDRFEIERTLEINAETVTRQAVKLQTRWPNALTRWVGRYRFCLPLMAAIGTTF